MRILIISFQFPPFKGAGCLRVGKTAKYLSRFGHDVRVVTARDQNVPTPSLPVELAIDRITYSKWLDVTRLRAAGGLVGGGAQSNGVSATPAPDAAVAKNTRSFRSRVWETARAIVLFPDREIGWFPFGRADALRVVEGWKPDIIVASAYPITSLLVAWSVSRVTGIPWVAEMRDLWADHPYYRFPEWRRRLEKRLERFVLRSAAGFVTVSEPLAKRLYDEYRKPMAVVYHGFDPEDYPARNAPAGRELLRLVYTGNTYEGAQNPVPLFEALAALNGSARLEWYGLRQPWVEQLASSTGAAPFVDFKGVVSHHDALAAQTGSDLLISFLWTDITQPGVLLTKNLEYLGAGRPILAVGPRENGASDLIEKRGAGITLQNADDIVQHLTGLLHQKRQRGEVAGVPATAQHGLSREEQTRKFEGLLLSLLPGVS